MKAFVSFCLAQQITSNNITAMFQNIGDPMLLSTKTANSLLTEEKRKTQSSSSSNGGGTFSAAMIIATVATTELNEEELGHMKGSNDKRKRER